MIAQGLAPDFKCTFNISSFLKFSHLLDCLICARNYVHCIVIINGAGLA